MRVNTHLFFLDLFHFVPFNNLFFVPGVKSTITVGIVGFPNVGKSSVINSLKRGRACNVGATPGVTKSMQCVELDTHVKLLDCPGIVMATGMSRRI